MKPSRKSRNDSCSEPLEELQLKGTMSDLKYSRIDDTRLETIISPLSTGPNFLRVIDLSFNEIGNKGAILLSKLIKVFMLMIG